MSDAPAAKHPSMTSTMKTKQPLIIWETIFPSSVVCIFQNVLPWPLPLFLVLPELEDIRMISSIRFQFVAASPSCFFRTCTDKAMSALPIRVCL